VAFAFNDYLQLTIEFGLLQLIILILLIWRGFTFRELPCDSQEYMNSLVYISRLTFATILTCMVFSYPFQNLTISLCFFIVLAILSNFDRTTILIWHISKTMITVVALAWLIVSGCLFYLGHQNIQYGLKWKQASAMFTTNRAESLAMYDSIAPKLSHNVSFLLNHGSILFLAGDYMQCARYFERYRYLVIGSDQLMMMGQSYEALNDFKQAEKNYFDAACLVPHRFIPKHHLFKLYQKMGCDKEAYQIALDIRDMKIKVFSQEVKDIKTEVNDYLLKHMSAIP
jgi:hypothetical protein